MTKYNVYFRGTVELLQPVFVNVPRPEEKIVKGDMVHSRPLYLPSGEAITVAYIPGHNVKGLERACSVMALADVHGATGGAEAASRKLSLPVFAALHHGGILGSKKDSFEDVLERRGLRERNALLSLFGTMPGKLKALWSFGDIVFDGNRYGRDSPVFERYSARRDALRTHPEVLESATPDEVRKVADYSKGTKLVSAERAERTKLLQANKKLNAKAEKRTQADKDAVAANLRKIAELDAVIAGMLGKDGEGSESVTRKDRFQGLASGLRPAHEMTLIGADEFEIGFAFLTLKHLQNACQIGGKVGTGNGNVKFAYDISVRPVGGWEDEDAGHVEVRPWGFDLVTEHPVILAGLAAVEAAREDPHRRLSLDVVPTDF